MTFLFDECCVAMLLCSNRSRTARTCSGCTVCAAIAPGVRRPPGHRDRINLSHQLCDHLAHRTEDSEREDVDPRTKSADDGAGFRHDSASSATLIVMAGLVPATHVFRTTTAARRGSVEQVRG